MSSTYHRLVRGLKAVMSKWRETSHLLVLREIAGARKLVKPSARKLVKPPSCLARQSGFTRWRAEAVPEYLRRYSSGAIIVVGQKMLTFLT
jgi:hypothetical protein